MGISSDSAERHQRDLARFQAVIMRAVEKADAELDAAEGAQALGSLVSTLHKAGRALRQSMALEVKLGRDEAAHDAALTEKAVAARKAQIRNKVDRLVWTENEQPDAAVESADLEERLDDEALYEGFLDEPLDEQVARQARAAGVTGEATAPYTPRSLRRAPPPYWSETFRRDADEEDDEGEVEEPDPAVVAEANATARIIAAAYRNANTPLPPPSAEQPETILFNGRLAPPRDLPSWECDDDSS